MKKKILNLAVVGLIFITPIDAEIIYTDIHAGILQTQLAKESNIGYTLGYGYAKTFENSLYFGGSFDFDIISLESDISYTYGVNMKLGYELVDGFALYALGAAAYQSIGYSDGGGFGYGAGVDYMLSESFALSAEYTTYSIAPEYMTELSYDYNRASLMLKYLF